MSEVKCRHCGGSDMSYEIIRKLLSPPIDTRYAVCRKCSVTVKDYTPEEIQADEKGDKE